MDWIKFNIENNHWFGNWHYFRYFFPEYELIGLPGKLFVNALKAIAPILVFVLVSSALSNAGDGIGSRFKTVIILYCSAGKRSKRAATILRRAGYKNVYYIEGDIENI